MKVVSYLKDKGRFLIAFVKRMFRPTWLGNFNFIIMQWLFIRIGIVGKMVNGEFVQTGWTLVRYPYPLTGWWNDYKWLYRPKKKGRNCA